MPMKSTKKKAAAAKRGGKAASTQAGAYVGEQLHKEKRGQGRAKSRKQAVAIGLSQARRAGVKVPRKGAGRAKSAPKSGTASGRKAAGRRAARKGAG